MDHDFNGQIWADNHEQTSNAIGRFIDKLRYVFVRLAQINYDAPWERHATRNCSSTRRIVP